jgi:hypothetical protein
MHEGMLPTLPSFVHVYNVPYPTCVTVVTGEELVEVVTGGMIANRFPTHTFRG